MSNDKKLSTPFLNSLQWVFSAAPNSIKNQINKVELMKLILGTGLAFLGGNGIGGVAALLDYLQGNLYTAFPAIVNVGWASALIAFVFDFLRRKYVHGETIITKQQKSKSKLELETGAKYTKE